jgi:energy-coupling factor transporter ATP-binding protein EcfA2
MNITLKRASRGVCVGKTGSGKSTLALRMVNAMPLPVLIIDTKYSATILEAADAGEWNIVDTIPKRLEGITVWRPDPDTLADPYAIDAEIDRLVRNSAICSVYIDELYQIHSNGRAGPGIIGLWTRGREMGFTVLASTQRPAWVSQFCLTESDQYYIFTLLLKDDRKKLAECLGSPEIVEKALDKHWFWYIEQGEDAVLCRPLGYLKCLTPEKEQTITEDNDTFVSPKLIK